MSFEELTEESLQGDWPGDEQLMNTCADILDAELPPRYPGLRSVMRPIKFFIEPLVEGQLQEEVN